MPPNYALACMQAGFLPGLPITFQPVNLSDVAQSGGLNIGLPEGVPTPQDMLPPLSLTTGGLNLNLGALTSLLRQSGQVRLPAAGRQARGAEGAVCGPPATAFRVSTEIRRRGVHA
jgi:hypothetical protein